MNSRANPDGFFDPLASTRISQGRKLMCTHTPLYTLTRMHSCVQMKAHRPIQAHICIYMPIHVHTHTGNLKSTSKKMTMSTGAG